MAIELFIKDKKENLRFWSIEVENGTHLLKKFGIVGGKITETRTHVPQGKAKRTQQQQLELEMNALVKKHLDAGYVRDPDKLTIKILPMLADKFNKPSDEPVYIQPKLDGVRMLIGRLNGEVILVTRTGKPVYNMDHVRDLVGPQLKEGEFLDGENYNESLPFEKIVGLCRTMLANENKNFRQIRFHVFDYFNLHKPELTFEERFEKVKSFKNIIVVETKKISNTHDIQKYHDTYVNNGYEGIMIRNPSGRYALGQRSKHLLKFKNFQTAEFKIINATSAEGRDEDTVVWICETPGPYSRTFKVRPKGTLEQRKFWLKNKFDYFHKMLTVQYQNMTSEGIPRFPVGLAIRDYE
jgi:ATP-dependent DNA ligase